MPTTFFPSGRITAAPPAFPMMLPSHIHTGRPSTSRTCGRRSSQPRGARCVQRSWGSVRWVSTSITLMSPMTSRWSCVVLMPATLLRYRVAQPRAQPPQRHLALGALEGADRGQPRRVGHPAPLDEVAGMGGHDRVDRVPARPRSRCDAASSSGSPPPSSAIDGSIATQVEPGGADAGRASSRRGRRDRSAR